MTVRQPPRSRLDHSVILGPKAFDEELARKNLSAFDRSILNRFILPREEFRLRRGNTIRPGKNSS